MTSKAADDVAKVLTAAMRVVSDLSNAAKHAGDDEAMYAANRAWTELFNIQCRNDRALPKRRRAS